MSCHERIREHVRAIIESRFSAVGVSPKIERIEQFEQTIGSSPVLDLEDGTGVSHYWLGEQVQGTGLVLHDRYQLWIITIRQQG